MLASRSARPLSPLGWPDATTSSFRSSTVCADDSRLVNSVNGQEVRVNPAQTYGVTLRSRHFLFPLPSTEACFHSLIPSSLTYRIGHCLYQGYDTTTYRSSTVFCAESQGSAWLTTAPTRSDGSCDLSPCVCSQWTQYANSAPVCSASVVGEQPVRW
jgi:hypothetical protein